MIARLHWVVALAGALLPAWAAAQNQVPMALRPDGLKFPDGTIQTTAASADSRKSFYLTESGHAGSEALTACAAGYHMAALYEMLDVSNLRYAAEIADARVTADMGQGPPVDSVDGGWVRTGTDTSDGREIKGLANCQLWSTNSVDAYGSTARLADYGDTAVSPEWLAPWEADTHFCASNLSVWCVEN